MKYGPLQHFEYVELDKHCHCPICESWRTAFARYNELLAKVWDHAKPLGKCKCEDCKVAMKARTPYLAALNRRDLYSEGSWHASTNMLKGERFMDWLHTEITGEKHGDGWWAAYAPEMRLGRWMQLYEQAAVASGVVLAKFPIPAAYMAVSAAVSAV